MKVTTENAILIADQKDGGVLLHRNTRQAFRLGAKEMTYWRALAESDSIESARASLSARPSGADAALAREFFGFVETLADRKLIAFRGGRAAQLVLLTRQHGFGATVLRGAKVLRNRLGWWFDAGFDRRHGTDTTGIVPVSELGAAGSSVAHAFYYVPTPTRIFVHALRQAIPAPEGYVFVDVGSGKGRMLLLASRFPFRRIIGIEFSATLNRIAQRNIRVYRSDERGCRDVASVCCDAVEFEWPDEDLVLYFWTPFLPPVLDRVLERIGASFARRSRRLIIIVYAAREDFIEPFERMPLLTRRQELSLPRIRNGYSGIRLFVFSNA